MGFLINVARGLGKFSKSYGRVFRYERPNNQNSTGESVQCEQKESKSRIEPSSSIKA